MKKICYLHKVSQYVPSEAYKGMESLFFKAYQRDTASAKDDF